MCAQYGLWPVQYHFHMRLHAMHLLHCSKGAWDRQLKNNIHSADVCLGAVAREQALFLC